MRILIKHKRNLHSAARQLIDHAAGRKIFAFYGAMGAGKTTFIRMICETLGAAGIAVSPTFTLVNEYKTGSGDSLYHIDFYRIKALSELYDFGIEEYLGGGNYCFIEWPELAEEVLPEETVKVRITVGPNQERIVETL